VSSKALKVMQHEARAEPSEAEHSFLSVMVKAPPSLLDPGLTGSDRIPERN
jgi:hypothetical protein